MMSICVLHTRSFYTESLSLSLPALQTCFALHIVPCLYALITSMLLCALRDKLIRLEDLFSTGCVQSSTASRIHGVHQGKTMVSISCSIPHCLVVVLSQQPPSSLLRYNVLIYINATSLQPSTCLWSSFYILYWIAFHSFLLWLITCSIKFASATEWWGVNCTDPT